MAYQATQVRKEIKDELAKSGWMMKDVVSEINRLNPDATTTPQNLSNKLSRGTLKYAEAKRIAEIIGCRIEWVPVSEESDEAPVRI